MLRPLSLILALTAMLGAAEGSSLSGRISDKTADRGIEGLTVTLTPPKKSDEAEAVTLTDKNGQYLVAGLRGGEYLLRIRLGSTLLVREQLHVEGKVSRDVSLENHGGSVAEKK